MHSLKNTIVAVGLLGLSFMFYQASTNQNPNAHLSNEVPALSINDGIDGFTKLNPLNTDSVSSGIDAIKSKLGNLPQLQMPDLSQPKQMVSDMANNLKSQMPDLSQPKQMVSDLASNFQNQIPDLSQPKQMVSDMANNFQNQMPDLSQPKQMVSDMASDFKNQLANKATQLKEQVSNGISDFQLDAPQLESPQLSAPQLSAPQLQAPGLNAPQLAATNITTPQPRSLEFNAPAPIRSQNLAPVTAEQTLLTPPATQDRNVRDQGLIAALKSQAAQRRNQATQSNDDFSVANVSATEDFQFTSQPIPSADSSFNRLAADSSAVDSGSNVFQAGAESAAPTMSFEAAWDRVDQLVKAEKFSDALSLLSQYYRRDDISGDQRERLNGWLDALAGKVIFSTEHHLEGFPFTVGNESLTDISSRWGVPAQLIYNINKSMIPNPAFVHQGTELKVVRGPFNGEIDMSNNVMTLFLGDLYAGRYPVKIGISGNPKPGQFRVLAKSIVGHSWRDAAGNEYPPSSPQNGYGPNWIGLSGSLCIHQIDADVTGAHTGCIGLSAKDSKDVFGILSKNSSIKIVR